MADRKTIDQFSKQVAFFFFVIVSRSILFAETPRAGADTHSHTRINLAFTYLSQCHKLTINFAFGSVACLIITWVFCAHRQMFGIAHQINQLKIRCSYKITSFSFVFFSFSQKDRSVSVAAT